MAIMQSLICEFLENSTIHGLAHISTTKSRTARVAWVAIVVACFAIAVTVITGSYNEWQESPVSTTITTHPITKLEFPEVTVCPPRGSDTAVNQALEKIKNVNFTERERQGLVNLSREIFIEIPSKRYSRQMSELLSPENMRSIANNMANMPKLNKHSKTISLESRELQGSFSTPGFGDSDYNGDFFDRSHSLHYVLQFPSSIKDILGNGGLIVSVHSQDSWSYSWERQLHIYEVKKDFEGAQDFCVREGKQLASFESQEEEDELKALLENRSGSSQVWIGGRRKTREGWRWLDGADWGFEEEWHSSALQRYDCLSAVSLDKGTKFSYAMFANMKRVFKVRWMDTKCSNNQSFVCLDSRNQTQQNMTFRFTKDSVLSSSFNIWWKYAPEQKDSSGIRLEWKIVNSSSVERTEFVSEELSGSSSSKACFCPLCNEKS